MTSGVYVCVYAEEGGDDDWWQIEFFIISSVYER